MGAFEAVQEAIKNKKDSPKKDEPASTIKPEEPKNESKNEPTSENKGTDLSANKSLFSFASLATTDSKPLFGQKTEGFSFAGANKPLFGTTSKPANESTNDDDTEQVEENEHDPHFEPIIPLPELVDVKTGEEEEEEVFKHRAKVYRYDTETKQWKERGVGDIKILKHPSRGTFRILLRRDQTLKIACNHYISEVMELKPMATSETALIWFAVDYADGDGKNEQLAVKFKTADTKNDFKAAFEAAQAELKNKETTSPTQSSNDSSNKTDSTKPFENRDDDVQRDEDDYEDDEDDDDVFGARIAAYSGDETNGIEVCNHLIAMQTTLDVTTPSERLKILYTGDIYSYRTFVIAIQ